LARYKNLGTWGNRRARIAAIRTLGKREEFFDQAVAEMWAMSRACSEKNVSNDAGAITFSGTLSGALVGARSGAGAGAGVWAGFGTVSGMSIGVEPG
jgi:hypothetical protein